MNKTVANVTIGLIALVWILAFYTMGFNVFSIFFGVIGTLMVGAGTQGWIKSKGEMYLASKYDESRR